MCGRERANEQEHESVEQERQQKKEGYVFVNVCVRENVGKIEKKLLVLSMSPSTHAHTHTHTPHVTLHTGNLGL